MPAKSLTLETDRETVLPPTNSDVNRILSDEDHAIKNQQPFYKNQEIALNYFSLLYQDAAQLTSMMRIQQMKKELQPVLESKAFVIQAGLCVEDMDNKSDDEITAYAENTSSMMNRLGDTMQGALQKPIVTIARAAGQLAKPRSEPFEKDGRWTYRGPLFNSMEDREIDPSRLYQSYAYSSTVSKTLAKQAGRDVYTSHEGLSILYEESLLQNDKVAGSGDMIWIGARTNSLENEQVKFAKNIQNVVGVKCSDTVEPEKLDTLLQTLNPVGEKAKIIVIMRHGAGKIDETLGPQLKVLEKYKENTIILCDPMHGNTKTDAITNKKTRYVYDIKYEVSSFARQCVENGIHPGGLHLEVNPDPTGVTECMGGNVTSLKDNYQSLVDPCLNIEQAEEVIETFAQTYKAALQPA